MHIYKLCLYSLYSNMQKLSTLSSVVTLFCVLLSACCRPFLNRREIRVIFSLIGATRIRLYYRRFSANYIDASGCRIDACGCRLDASGCQIDLARFRPIRGSETLRKWHVHKLWGVIPPPHPRIFFGEKVINCESLPRKIVLFFLSLFFT